MRINFFIDTRLTFILFRQVFGTVPEKSDDESDNQETMTTLQLFHKQRTQKATAVTTELEDSEEATSGGTLPILSCLPLRLCRLFHLHLHCALPPFQYIKLVPRHDLLLDRLICIQALANLCHLLVILTLIQNIYLLLVL